MGDRVFFVGDINPSSPLEAIGEAFDRFASVVVQRVYTAIDGERVCYCKIRLNTDDYYTTWIYEMSPDVFKRGRRWIIDRRSYKRLKANNELDNWLRRATVSDFQSAQKKMQNCHRSQKMSIDQLSALPDCLLAYILSLLDEKDALITSVLSKRWQFLYTEVPRLAFRESSGEIEKIREFVSRVHKRLQVCSRNGLESFEVNLKYNKCFARDVNAWIKFVVGKKVKEIHLMLNSGDTHKLPKIIYSNPSLKVLSLERCFMSPRRTIKWQSLTLLQLWSMQLRQRVIENILSGCPALCCLCITECWGFKCLKVDSRSLQKLVVVNMNFFCNEPLLEISAPYIQCLFIALDPGEQRFHLANIRSVVGAHIVFTGEYFDSSSEEVMSNAKDLLEETQHVKVLTLSPSFLEVVSMSLVKGWQLPQSRRRSLIISDIITYKLPHVSGIMGLLESSPELETLIIDGSFISKEWDPDLDCELLHLKKVEIRKFAEAMLTLAGILLKRATFLEEMVIVTDDLQDTKDFLKISRTLLMYPRSSQKALVLFR